MRNWLFTRPANGLMPMLASRSTASISTEFVASKILEQSFKAGSVSVLDVEEATYYRIDAEILFVQAGGKVALEPLSNRHLTHSILREPIMATVYVNDKPVDIGNDKLNLIQAAEKAGVFIPRYCWHPALSVVASCRMCLVEAGEKKPDGTVAMQPRVVPACQTPAKDGTVIVTDSPKAKAAQQQTLEDLLLNHPLDCPVCDKAGECMLQDFSYRFGKSESRMVDDKNHPPNKDYIGEHITLFADRCILCSRCVRFTREISGTAELQVTSRGHHSEIDIFPGEPVNNKLAGNVVDICPVGALCSKDFLYKQRVWFLKDQKSVCPECSTGCSIHVDHNKDMVQRLRPRENPLAQGFFMCDEGRFDYAYVNDRGRLPEPLVSRTGQASCHVLGKDIAAAARGVDQGGRRQSQRRRGRALPVYHRGGRISAGPSVQGPVEGLPAFPRLGADARRG